VVGRLVADGATVVAADVDEGGLRTLARSHGPAVLPVVADLTDPGGIDSVVEAVERLGRVDVLVNNAGIVVITPFAEVSTAELERELDLNYRLPLVLTHRLHQHLRRSRGVVVTVASLGAFVPLAESPGYSASKAALRMLMAALARSTPTTGVRVAVVNPSAVDTAMLRREAAGGGSPLNFLGTPMPAERVADAVLTAARSPRPRVERDLPRAEGLLVRGAGLAPGLTRRVLPLLTGLGERGRRRYLAR
jgi:NAD(P)-dependent dehydrogenase (short-subunit alcohol dehydrogenase family)